VEEDALENGFMEIDETRAPEGEIERGQNLERGRVGEERRMRERKKKKKK
jgi:hypothetical protein